MQFPRFAHRDMVQSQHRLMTEHLGINHVVTVVGPSMGGMQALQWGVSHPDFMDSLVALVPLARTPAWSIVVTEATRKAIMLDPAWNNGNYTSPPTAGIRVWRDVLGSGCAPRRCTDHFASPLRPAWSRPRKTIINLFDATLHLPDVAYDAHDVWATRNGRGLAKALPDQGEDGDLWGEGSAQPGVGSSRRPYIRDVPRSRHPESSPGILPRWLHSATWILSIWRGTFP